MQRRSLLKTVAAGGLASIASTTTAGARALPGAGVEELDAFHVVRGEGEVVRAIENPTVDDLKRTEELLGPNESLVTPDRQCLTYCAEDCGAVCDIEDQCLFECSCGLGCRWCC